MVPALSVSALMWDQLAASGGVTLYFMTLKSVGREGSAIDLTISLPSGEIKITYAAFHIETALICLYII